jgi:uncharacterized protein (TIGR03067 family)
MPLLALLAAGLFAGALLSAPVPKAVKKRTDAEAMAGRWKGVSFNGQGNTEWSLVVADGKITINDAGTAPAAAPFALDESHSPKHLDISWKGWPNPQLYIYLIDGDTLTLCHAQPGQPRPTVFDGGGTDGRYCFVFERVKDEPKKDK